MCVLFLSFARKKKIPKRKGTGYVYGATPILPAQTGLELATLRQIAPYLRLTISPLDAPTPMPEGCAIECCAVKRCAIQDLSLIHI